jgi:hypothetical protein
VLKKGEADADMATNAGAVDNDGLIGDMACHGAVNR